MRKLIGRILFLLRIPIKTSVLSQDKLAFGFGRYISNKAEFMFPLPEYLARKRILVVFNGTNILIKEK
jgi:hypothetical protein